MILITGGTGYLGSIIKNYFLSQNIECISVDKEEDQDTHPNLYKITADINDIGKIEKIFAKYHPRAIIHCAALLQQSRLNKEQFYNTNVTSTKNLADLCIKYGAKDFIFISSNCIYGHVDSLNIKEDKVSTPFEAYGKSKLLSENILKSYKDLNIAILRCPTIISEGRLGILSIVFDFIKEGKKLWLVGSGDNKYQFIYGNDVAFLCQKILDQKKYGVFNVGTTQIESLKEIFSNLIQYANSKSQIRHFPAWLALPVMKICYKLGISPLGPYQYNMITKNYSGDISKIRDELGWQPSMSNSEILITAYDYYIKNYEVLIKNSNLTGHKKLGRAGIINFLKWIS